MKPKLMNFESKSPPRKQMVKIVKLWKKRGQKTWVDRYIFSNAAFRREEKKEGSM
jgi:hypothetical protein